MTKRFLPAVVLAVVVVLAAAVSASAQMSLPTVPPTTATADMPVIQWELIPGAVYWHADIGFSLSVGCRTITREPTWYPNGQGENVAPRNPYVYLYLKVFDTTDGGWRPVYASKTGATPPANAQVCNLMKGVDSVTFTGINIPYSYRNTPEKIANLTWMIRYYKWGRFPGQQHDRLELVPGQILNGVTDNLFDGKPPAEAAAEADDWGEWYDR